MNSNIPELVRTTGRPSLPIPETSSILLCTGNTFGKSRYRGWSAGNLRAAARCDDGGNPARDAVKFTASPQALYGGNCRDSGSGWIFRQSSFLHMDRMRITNLLPREPEASGLYKDNHRLRNRDMVPSISIRDKQGTFLQLNKARICT
jgi:hypothetical protein